MSIPATQKAFIHSEKFGAIELKEIAVPSPVQGEILVKIISAALNPVDWKIAKVYGWHIYPISLGRDLAGEVVAVGEGVQEFVVGDRVFAQATGDLELGRAAFAQYVVLPVKLTGKIPDDISYDVASSLPVALFGGITGLYNELPYGLGLDLPFGEGRGKYKDTPLVIIGGSGAVGQISHDPTRETIWILTNHHHGIAENEAFLKEIGAENVLDRNLADSEIIASVKKITDKPISYVFDTASFSHTQRLGVALLAPRGRLGLVLPPQHGELEDGKTSFYMNASSWFPQNDELAPEFFHEWSNELLHLIKPNRIEVLPGGLHGVLGGLERLEKGEVSGLKLVAHPQETQ